MRTELLILRLIHILSGVFWAGASFLSTFYIEPTVRASGDAGRGFMQRLGTQTSFSTAMLAAALLNVGAGLWLMDIVSDGFSAAWFGTGFGQGLTIGMLAGLGAAFTGYWIQFRSIRRMKAIGQAVAASGGPPTPEQGAELGRLQAKLSKGGRATTAMLLVAVIMMAISRYLPAIL